MVLAIVGGGSFYGSTTGSTRWMQPTMTITGQRNASQRKHGTGNTCTENNMQITSLEKKQTNTTKGTMATRWTQTHRKNRQTVQQLETAVAVSEVDRIYWTISCTLCTVQQPKHTLMKNCSLPLPYRHNVQLSFDRRPNGACVHAAGCF